MKKLIQSARNAMAMAYAPYSGFFVGAALRCADGTVFTGCNVENASYGAANCAERTAFFKAVSEGHREFTDIALCGGKNGEISDFCPPCGICRQVMSEFCGNDFQIHLIGPGDAVRSYTLAELLPGQFTAEAMGDK